MKWFKFENRIKEDLYDYKSGEDALDIWSAIDSDVNTLNRKNRKKDNKLLFFAWFLIGALSLAYFSIYNKEIVLRESKNKLVSKGEFINENVHREVDPNKVSSKNTDDNASKSGTINEKKIKALESEKVNSKSTAKLDAVGFEVDNVDKISIATTGANRKTESLKNNQEKQQNSYVISRSKKNIAGTIADTIEGPIEPIKKKALVTKTLTPLLDVEKDRTVGNENKKANTLEDSDDIVHVRNEKALSHLSLVALDEIESDNLFILPPSLNNQNESVDARKGNNHKFSLGFNTGLFYASKTIKAKESDELSFEQSRLDTERTLETLHGSIYGGYNLNKRISISIGLGYTRINEGFTFVEEFADSRLVDGERFVFTGPGVRPTRFDLIGLIEEVESTTTSYTLYNKFELIDIPVFISYMWNANKWSYGFQAGIITNLKFKGSGRILKSENRSEEISDLDIFKNSLGISYGLNLLIERRLNSEFSLLFTPSFRYFPGEFTKEAYGLQQEYQLAGLDVGLRYNF